MQDKLKKLSKRDRRVPSKWERMTELEEMLEAFRRHDPTSPLVDEARERLRRLKA